MASINVSNLVSGSFDWQTMVDQLIQVDGRPITTLQQQEATNKQKLNSLSSLESELSTLQDYTQALSNSSLFAGRTATASGSGWTAASADNAAPGTYSLAVTRLATAATRTGSGDIAAKLSATDDVSGLTLASLSTATAVTAGTFSVNGRQITIGLADSLQDVFTKISAATGGLVTAHYSSATDQVTLSSSDDSDVVLGTPTDSSNFLQVMRLANTGTGETASVSALGAISLDAPLATAGLRASLGAVDETGHGTFSINGVSIDYNVNDDSLSAVLARITASTAGVNARFDTATNRVILTNRSTGDTGLGANEAAGGLLDALGLTAASTFQHGQDALFSVNGGAAKTSASNTLDATTLGIAGLSVQITSATTQTITVATNSAGMKTAVQNFLNEYNTVKSYIDSLTNVSVDSAGKVTASILNGNHEIQNWISGLRSAAFAQVSGLTGTVKRLDNLGIDFDSSGQLVVKDEAKLDAALADHSADVGAFFNTATTGFAAKINTYLNSILGLTGGLALQSETLNRQNDSIEKQVATLQRQLDQERAQLTASFEAMQTAQSNAQAQMKYLTQMFFNNSSNSSGSGN